MRKIFIVGTIHGQYTPDAELREVLEDLKPDQVLVELSEAPTTEMKDRLIYATEMVFAYNWAKDKGLTVGTFDVDDQHSYFKEGKGPNDPEYKKLMEKQQAIIKEHSWREFNHEALNELLDDPLIPILFDIKSDEKREDQMLENLTRLMFKEGRIVIVTGAGHLKFFESKIPDVKIPLRDKR